MVETAATMISTSGHQRVSGRVGVSGEVIKEIIHARVASPIPHPGKCVTFELLHTISVRRAGTPQPSQEGVMTLLQPPGCFLDAAQHPQRVAGPDLGDLSLRVATVCELEGDLQRFARIVPAVDAATTVEVG